MVNVPRQRLLEEIETCGVMRLLELYSTYLAVAKSAHTQQDRRKGRSAGEVLTVIRDRFRRMEVAEAKMLADTEAVSSAGGND